VQLIRQACSHLTHAGATLASPYRVETISGPFDCACGMDSLTRCTTAVIPSNHSSTACRYGSRQAQYSFGDPLMMLSCNIFSRSRWNVSAQQAAGSTLSGYCHALSMMAGVHARFAAPIVGIRRRSLKSKTYPFAYLAVRLYDDT
jgi:hypothetical protein